MNLLLAIFVPGVAVATIVFLDVVQRGFDANF
jgi:hypothetical protein